MEILSDKTIVSLRKMMITLNFLIVIYYSSLFLLGTNYILHQGYAISFLKQVAYVPESPVANFIFAIVMYSLLLIIMYIRMEDKKQPFNGLATVEYIIAILIILALNGSYTGLVLLVLSDLLYNANHLKYWTGLTIITAILLLVLDYDVLSMIVRMPSLNTYLMYFPTTTRVMCVFFTNILASLNVVLFLGFLIVSLLKQQRERDKIQEELEFVSQINTQLKDYTALSQLDIEDNERKRISREIHDTLGHALTGMSAGLDACIVLLDLDKDKAREQLLVLSKVVKDGIKDVRRSLNKLRPGVLEDLSLKEAIVKLCEDSEQTSNIFVNLYYEWEDLDLEKTKEDIIYRIVQESITNAVRHGKAGEVDVEFFKEHDKYMIVIQDDGKGTNEIKDGYGLKQMKERVAILNGVIHFVSEEGKGFRTVVEIRQ